MSIKNNLLNKFNYIIIILLIYYYMNKLLHTEITGLEFNNLFNKKFYKITNENEKHYGLQYRDGLNIDIQEFIPNDTCIGHGIYFSDLYNIALYFDYGIYIREIEIPSDARIFIYQNKYKTNKIIFKSRVLIKDFEYWSNYDFCTISICNNGLAIQYINNNYKTYNLIEKAIQQNSYAIEFVDEKMQDEKLCKQAILSTRNNSVFLSYIQKQTFILCKTMVLINGLSIKYVINQTTELCKYAISQNPYAVIYVKKLTKNLLDYAYSKDPYISKFY